MHPLRVHRAELVAHRGRMVVVSLLSLDKRVTFVISFVCERLHIIGGVACPKPSAI